MRDSGYTSIGRFSTGPEPQGERPDDETDTVYSNFDHVLDADVVRELEGRPGEVCAQHAAWNFCGYVWVTSAGKWCDEVWRFNSPVEVIRGEAVEAVIEAVNDKYGSD